MQALVHLRVQVRCSQSLGLPRLQQGGNIGPSHVRLAAISKLRLGTRPCFELCLFFDPSLAIAACRSGPGGTFRMHHRFVDHEGL